MAVLTALATVATIAGTAVGIAGTIQSMNAQKKALVLPVQTRQLVAMPLVLFKVLDKVRKLVPVSLQLIGRMQQAVCSAQWVVALRHLQALYRVLRTRYADKWNTMELK